MGPKATVIWAKAIGQASVYFGQMFKVFLVFFFSKGVCSKGKNLLALGENSFSFRVNPIPNET